MQKPTEFLNINGTEHPIHFGYAALAAFERRTDISFDKLGKALETGLKLNVILELTFCGLISGYRREGKTGTELPFKNTDDVADLLDYDFEKSIEDVMAIFERQVSKKEEKKPTSKRNTGVKKK